jgi:ABC-type iron transport system FetAB ATPase subunit
MPLSVDQRQRLAIACSIVKNSPVLPLDRATCALDAENERLARQALDRVADQRTSDCSSAHHRAKGGPWCRHGKRPHRLTGLHSDLTQGAGPGSQACNSAAVT